MIRGKGLCDDNVAVLHVADQDLYARDQTTYKGAKVYHLAAKACSQTTVEQQRDLGVGGLYLLPCAERLLMVVDRDGQSLSRDRSGGVSIDSNQSLGWDRAFLLSVCGNTSREGECNEERGSS